MLTGRSLSKALLDTEKVVARCKIRKKSMYAISVDSFGAVRIHLKPAEFVRVFKMLRVRRSTLESSVYKGDLHASFEALQTKFTCMVHAGTPEFEALTGGKSLLGQAQRIESTAPRPRLPKPTVGLMPGR